MWNCTDLMKGTTTVEETGELYYSLREASKNELEDFMRENKLNVSVSERKT